MCAQHQKTSVELLNTARKTASETANYSSEATREAIVKKFQDVFDGNKPYDWTPTLCCRGGWCQCVKIPGSSSLIIRVVLANRALG
jgi:hypothetical protein